MPKCSLRQLLSRATSRRNGSANGQLPSFGGNGTWLGGESVLPWGFGQHQYSGFLSLLYAYLFPYFLSLHYTYLSLFIFQWSISFNNQEFTKETGLILLQNVKARDTTQCSPARGEEAEQREEAKPHPQQGKWGWASATQGMTGGWGASQETERARSWWPNCHQLSGAPPPAASGNRALWCPRHEVI